MPLSTSDKDLLIELGREKSITIYSRPSSHEKLDLLYSPLPSPREHELYYDLKAHDVRIHFSPLHFVQGR